MRSIRKHEMSLAPEQVMELPKGAHILCITTDGDSPFIVALVDPNAPTVKCAFSLFEEGDTFDEWREDNKCGVRGDYKGSFTLSGGIERHIVQRVA